jgi:hypothetical protein
MKKKSKNVLNPGLHKAREYLQLSGDPARFEEYREAAGRAGCRSVQEWAMDRLDLAAMTEERAADAVHVAAALHHVETTRAPQ